MEESAGTFRVRRKVRTSRAALPFLTPPSLVSVARLFRCRSAYWYAIVASPENTQRAWKRVKRSSPLNGEQKNFLSRSRDASPCILAFYSSALNPSRGEWDSASGCSRGGRRSGDVRMEIFQNLVLNHFIFLRQNLNFLNFCSFCRSLRNETTPEMGYTTRNICRKYDIIEEQIERELEDVKLSFHIISIFQYIISFLCIITCQTLFY